jgi:hypothetical protein
MELTFADRPLADLCNCKRAMIDEWGEPLAELVAERLCQLAASELGKVETLPYATVKTTSRGSVTIEFDAGQVCVRCEAGPDGRAGRNPGAVQRLRVQTIKVARSGETR